MKTTVEIDQDLFSELKAEAQEAGTSFRSVLNRALRLGLRGSRVRDKARRYRVAPVSMGEPLAGVPSLDKALALAGDLEDAEVISELERRK